MSAEITQRIEKIISSKPIVVFMKGTPDNPQCGFSAHTIEALRQAGASSENMAFFDVLGDNDIREGVKIYSDWPTIPQVYISGEFQGGCDIILDMAESGELRQKIRHLA